MHREESIALRGVHKGALLGSPLSCYDCHFPAHRALLIYTFASLRSVSVSCTYYLELSGTKTTLALKAYSHYGHLPMPVYLSIMIVQEAICFHGTDGQPADILFNEWIVKVITGHCSEQ